MSITTCSRCGGLYEAGSEEQANEPDRLCRSCVRGDRTFASRDEAARFSGELARAGGAYHVTREGLSPATVPEAVLDGPVLVLLQHRGRIVRGLSDEGRELMRGFEWIVVDDAQGDKDAQAILDAVQLYGDARPPEVIHEGIIARTNRLASAFELILLDAQEGLDPRAPHVIAAVERHIQQLRDRAACEDDRADG